MRLIFASGNKGKIREAGEILGSAYEIASSAMMGITEDIPETGNSFRENSLQKAMYLWDRFHEMCMADDSGLEVDALGGAPGLYSARYAGEEKNFSKNIDKVLHELSVLEVKALAAGEPAVPRTARFRCCVTLITPDGEPHFFETALEGKIGYERKGEGGFGYDPIFLPDCFGGELSLAQVTEEQKNAVSHRGNAMRKMAAFLKENSAI